MRAARARGKATLPWNILGLLVFVVMIFPVYWMFSSAFQPTDDLNKLKPSWFPAHPTLQHFRDAVDRPYFWSSMKNSLIIVSFTVLISIALAFLAAVALAKFRFSGRKLFIVALIGIQMLPQVGLIIPLYVVLSRYQLTTNQYVLIGVIITYMTFALPFAVWTLRGFLLNIPKELEEAAMVDGSSRVGAFTKILLPLVAPGLVATAVFVFVTSWNEFIFAYVLLNDQSKQTITVWLSDFYGTSRQIDWGGLMAGSILAAIPVLIFFVIVQRKIAFGLTAGAVKA
jgi:N,N'-diacetylchitobiose transport system permease protein